MVARQRARLRKIEGTEMDLTPDTLLRRAATAEQLTKSGHQRDAGHDGYPRRGTAVSVFWPGPALSLGKRAGVGRKQVERTALQYVRAKGGSLTVAHQTQPSLSLK